MIDPINWQEPAAFAAVGLAAAAVGRRLWRQVRAFGDTQGGGGCGGCSGCGPQKDPASKNAPGQEPKPALLQIQTRPPLHVRRPRQP